MKPVTVLLADDHRIVAEGLKRLLEPEFELIGVVEDGRALLAAARELQPDVIVSDISMPELNGVEALEELKKLIPEVRVVFLTMHHNVAYARQAMAAGALGYVLKHSAAEELILAVRAAAAGRTFVSPAIAGQLLESLRAGDGPNDNPAARLTLRQREILRLLVDGHSAKAIAARLDISPRTVEFHKYAMMETLGVTTTAELIRFALQTGVSDV
ncbi:MAG: response regulator transcription factor [Xanthomonadales bacterium]|jgi:DNA-binding NarL/FixJ family response regulator|nr:response regulator transcription factor [Xanthomonadales bacterium]